MPLGWSASFMQQQRQQLSAVHAASVLGPYQQQQQPQVSAKPTGQGVNLDDSMQRFQFNRLDFALSGLM